MLSSLFIIVSMITLLCFQHVVQLVHCINDYIVVFQLGVGHVLPDQSVTLLFFSLVLGMFFLTNLLHCCFSAWCWACSSWPICYIVVFQLGVGHVLPDQSVTLLFFSLVLGMFFLTNLLHCCFSAWCWACSSWPICYIVVFQLSVRHVLPDQPVTLLFFSLVFGMFFLTNLILWVNGSSAAIPFTTLVALLALWFGISVPLTFVGAYFGFKKRVSKKIVLLLVSTW